MQIQFYMQAAYPGIFFRLCLHFNALIEEQGHKQAKKGSSVNKTNSLLPEKQFLLQTHRTEVCAYVF